MLTILVINFLGPSYTKVKQKRLRYAPPSQSNTIFR